MKLSYPTRKGNTTQDLPMATISPDFIIGIDPDSDESGYAVLDRRKRSIELWTFSMTELVRRLMLLEKKKTPVLIVIEDVWTNSANWHITKGQTPAAIAKTGYNLGMCARTGKVIYEFACALGLPTYVQRPLAKHWKHSTGKISHAELVEHLEKLRVRTESPGFRYSNQEERDAALLALHHIATRIPSKNEEQQTSNA